MRFQTCVFLESHAHRLPIHHPLYLLVEETLQNVIHCPVILVYMANSTLQSEQHPDEAKEKQRVQEIIHYLHDNCPTVSGSDSPTMDSTFVDVRAYSGCGTDPKSRKFARKHVYIQKYLVDAWMKARHRSNRYAQVPNAIGLRHFYLLTFFIKLCLLRGLVTVVKLAFMSENIDVKDQACGLPRLLHGSPCTFERFLCEWNGWFVLYSPHLDMRHAYNSLYAIVFEDNSCHVEVTISYTSEKTRTLLRLAAGDWMFPPVTNALHHCHKQRIWNSPPTNDPRPRIIEMTPWKSDKEKAKGLFAPAARWFNRAQDLVEE